MALFALFLAVPLIEIALFIQIGGLIGLWPTLAVVVATAALGTWLVRSQGAAELSRLRGALDRLDDPTEPLAHGAMILFSGALLLTPGFFTDAVGFALLVPGVRQRVFAMIRARIVVQSAGGPSPRPPRDDVIDGEYQDLTPPPGSDRPSGWTRS